MESNGKGVDAKATRVAYTSTGRDLGRARHQRPHAFYRESTRARA